MEKAKTKLTIVIPYELQDEISVYFQQSVAHGVWVDWGDGDYPETYDTVGKVQATHAYANPGTYVITMYTVDDCVLALGWGKVDESMIGGNVEGIRYMLEKAEIGEDVSEITRYAFYECKNMAEVVLPDTLGGIGDFAFAGCDALENVRLPSGIAELRRGVFMGCSALKKVELPVNLVSVKEHVFYGCTHLSEIDMTNLSVIAKSAFEGCKKLKVIDLGNKIMSIGDSAFQGCETAMRLNLGNAVTIGRRAFANCPALASLDIPESTKLIAAEAFAGCKFANKVICNSTTIPVMQDADVFDGSNMTELVVPSGMAESYKQAPNWCVYADNIVEVVA